MKKQTWIIILSVALVLSILLNIAYSYTIPYINTEWENAYEKNDIEWCEISNRDNAVINDFIDELVYYNEEYKNIPYMEDLDCFS